MSETPDPSWSSTDPGTKRTYHHPIHPDGPADRAMPVMVVRGVRDGATLLTLAGVHGDEYEPMAAVQRVFAALDPTTLSGTWVAVACCNVDAYLAAGREGPVDGLNLARVFPGTPEGTLTEHVAHCLTEDFIRHASFLCDLHSAGRIFRMVPLAGYIMAEPELTTIQRDAARVFGLPLVWGTAPNEGRTLSAAYAHGVPAIYCETTGAGGCRDEDVAAYAEGLRRLMIHLGMLDGHVQPPPDQRLVEDPTPESGHLQVKNVTPVDGLFRPAVDLYDKVAPGDLLGRVTDLFGNVTFECRTDTVGTVILVRHLTRVNAGDSLAVVIDMDQTTTRR
ncbi:MAG: succinylglutamate desuccinylase/aspartoacylase family protein [Phycisphaerae bacterium]|nr:succinylglutamate desuccinylase/aspartoacylase family protein [Phycisphaerae bacterium]